VVKVEEQVPISL